MIGVSRGVSASERVTSQLGLQLLSANFKSTSYDGNLAQHNTRNSGLVLFYYPYYFIPALGRANAERGAYVVQGVIVKELR